MKTYIILLILFTIGVTGCKKFLEVDPPVNQVTTAAVFSSNETATAAMLGIYIEMMGHGELFTSGATTLYTGMYTDELSHVNSMAYEEYVNSRLLLNSHSYIESAFWTPAYRYIYASNLIIEQLQKSTGITTEVRNRLIGEALFIRAFNYFNLVNLFGDVPLVTTTDYQLNASLGRTSSIQVYQQITADLTRAISILPVVYTGAGRTRPNQMAAQALLARVHLYNRNWHGAISAASAVIGSSGYLLEASPSNVFLKDSREMIWQLLPVRPTYNTFEGSQVINPSPQAAPTFYVHPSLLSAFTLGDSRNAWIGSRIYNGGTVNYPAKYKVTVNAPSVTEYYGVLRLAELYLIRAEARGQANDLAGALDDINVIRARAGLGAYHNLSQADLLLAIETERRIEFAFEWGHRFFDLKRWGKANTILGSLKPTWTSNAQLWPIPQSQMLMNPSLVQNPGY